MKILVTGSNGQLGNELRVISQDSKSEYEFADIAELDITDLSAVEKYIASSKPDILVNCAAYTDVNRAESDYNKAELINAVAPGILAEVCNKFNVKLIHVSTDYVFDGSANIPYNEESAVNPVSAYGKTKLAGEENIIKNTENFIIIRTCWLYSSFGKNFVKTMKSLGETKDEISVVFDQTGTPTYAADLAEAIEKICYLTREDEKNFVCGIYQYSDEGVCSWYDFAIEIMNVFGLKCKVKPIETSEYPAPAARPAYSVLNKKKIRDTFKLTIPYWRDSLKRCAELLK